MSKNYDVHSLVHIKWICKYYIVFVPKYRRKAFYDEKRLEIREIIRKLCTWKGVEILEGEVCEDHNTSVTQYLAQNFPLVSTGHNSIPCLNTILTSHSYED